MEAMHRRFGLQGAAMSARRSGPKQKENGSIGIQACVVIFFPDGPYWYCKDDPAAPMPSPTPPGDGGGGGGGGGGGNDPCASCEPHAPAPTSLSNEAPQDTLPLNCANPSLSEVAICTEPEASPMQRQQIEEALKRIESLGGACVDIAVRGRELLAATNPPAVRVFATRKYPAGGYGNKNAYGFGKHGIALETAWFANGTKRDSKGFNLDATLAHEIEHTMGQYHWDDADSRTLNDLHCSGL